MTERRVVTVNRHDDGNEVSAHLEVHMVKPHMKARARKLVELLIYDLEEELFGGEE